jgi:ubiquinone/menaquinone biosynthesis C-methylase UbiE
MTRSHHDPGLYAKLLLETDCLREGVIGEIIRWLDLPPGSRGLDAGCGAGIHTVQLSDAVGPSGHVTGLDISGQLLGIARDRAKQAGCGKTVDFRQGDINHLPFPRESFDWAWSADCIGPGTGDPFKQVEGLTRTIRPGGLIVVLAWSSQGLLPGYPVLEARLNATSAGIAPFTESMRPALHLFRAREWMSGAGLEPVTARSFAGDIQPPLDSNTRRALLHLFDMRWGETGDEMAPEDRDLYRRLTLPSSPDFILDQPGYYAFFTYTVFRGRKPDAIQDG